MLKSMGRIAAALLVAATVGCSGSSGGNANKSDTGNKGAQQQNQTAGDTTKAQADGGSSALDQELKRQSNIYKEFLKHNAEQAAKHREADKKMLDSMRKNQQQAQQDEVKRLQLKEGLISEDEADQGRQNKESSNKSGQGKKSQKNANSAASDQTEASSSGGKGGK